MNMKQNTIILAVNVPKSVRIFSLQNLYLTRDIAIIETTCILKN